VLDSRVPTRAVTYVHLAVKGSCQPTPLLRIMISQERWLLVLYRRFPSSNPVRDHLRRTAKGQCIGALRPRGVAAARVVSVRDVDVVARALLLLVWSPCVMLTWWPRATSRRLLAARALGVSR
jgi:hypothetical protein